MVPTRSGRCWAQFERRNCVSQKSRCQIWRARWIRVFKSRHLGIRMCVTAAAIFQKWRQGIVSPVKASESQGWVLRGAVRFFGGVGQKIVNRFGGFSFCRCCHPCRFENVQLSLSVRDVGICGEKCGSAQRQTTTKQLQNLLFGNISDLKVSKFWLKSSTKGSSWFKKLGRRLKMELEPFPKEAKEFCKNDIDLLSGN
jgi:hypothetical protein